MSVDTLLLNSAMGNPAPLTYGQGLASRANLNNVSTVCLGMGQHSRLPPELPLSPLAGRPRRAFRSSGVSETAVGSSNSRNVKMVRLGKEQQHWTSFCSFFVSIGGQGSHWTSSNPLVFVFRHVSW